MLLVLPRLKDPGRERTEFRTRTATRTSSKTAVRCSVGRHTRGNFFLLLSMSSVSVPVTDYTYRFVVRALFCQIKSRMQLVTERIISLCSVLDRRGLTQDDSSVSATPAASSSSDPVSQTTVSTHTQMLTWVTFGGIN